MNLRFIVYHKMFGTDGEDDYKNTQLYDEGDEDLGLFGDLSSFEGLALEDENELSAESGMSCPQCL